MARRRVSGLALITNDYAKNALKMQHIFAHNGLP